MTGSMLIPNDQGTNTLLFLDKETATAQPEVNALQFARAALKREKASPSVRSGNIKFLVEWIKFAEAPKFEEALNAELPEEPISLKKPLSSTTQVSPRKKTPEELIKESFEKSKALISQTK